MTRNIDVFVSYKQEERALMRKVVDGLHKAGYSAVADINIARNEEFGDAIDQMIRAAKLTVTLWTKKVLKANGLRTNLAKPWRWKRQVKIPNGWVFWWRMYLSPYRPISAANRCSIWRPMGA